MQSRQVPIAIISKEYAAQLLGYIADVEQGNPVDTDLIPDISDDPDGHLEDMCEKLSDALSGENPHISRNELLWIILEALYHRNCLCNDAEDHPETQLHLF